MFGVSTLCLHDLPLDRALEEILRVTDHIEIMDEGLHFLTSADPLENFSAKFTIHSPCRGTNIASLLEPIRKASVEVMEQCFTLAAEVDAGLVIHPGYFAWPQDRREAEQQLKTSLADLQKIANEYSLPFFIENMGNWEHFFLKTPRELPLIGSAGFALDVGHAHQNGCLAEFLKYPAQHYHLHDNYGKEDSHETVGSCSIDFTEVMRAVKRDKIVPVIEVNSFDGAIKSIEKLRAL
jgi:sugar phosphate isomerase/epimerase